jgi:HK97 family phage portal protein
VRSLSAITYAARQAVGNSLAAAEYTGRTVGEGAMPQIALKFANKMTKEQAQALRESFVATYSGVGNRKFPLVLTEGGDVKQLSISPVDMQLLEMRNFESTAINEVTGVPPVLIGKTEKVSAWGAGIEQITLGYVKFTVKPMAKVWRDELNRKLFRRAGQYVEFDMTDLLRGDSKALAEFYKAALGGPGSGDGWMSQNEVRRLQHLPPKANGDTLFKAQAGTTAKPTKPDTTDGEPA